MSPWPPLHAASAAGNTEMVKLLLDHGIQVDLLDENGLSPLHAASARGRPVIVKLLLDHGAQVDLQEPSGRSSLHLASVQGHTRTAKLLLQHGAQVDLPENKRGQSPLHLASALGHAKTVELLLDHGAQVDLQEDIGWTALHVASAEGHPEIVKVLLDHGAQVDLINDEGFSALHVAKAETAKLLLEHMSLPKNKPLLDSGAKVDQQDQPLVASAGEHTACGAKDDKGEAATEGHAKVEKVSLEHGRQREPIHPTESIKNQKSALAPPTAASVKGTLTLSNLLKELWPLASDWKTIGTMLNVPHETLKPCLLDILLAIVN